MSGNPLNLLFGAVGAALKPFGPKKKAPPPPMPLPVAQTRPSAVLDAVAGRQGSRANMRSGAGGAEAGGGTKTQLGA